MGGKYLRFLLNTIVLMLFTMLGMPSNAQHGEVTPQIIQDLQSGRWQVRRDAFEHLLAIPDAVDQPHVQVLLIQLRERENIESNKNDPDLFEDDDYLVYDDRFTSLVQEIAVKNNNGRAWDALANMRYNPDSEYGKWLASHQEALPSLEKLLHSPYFPRRANAVYDISLMLANSKAFESVKTFSPQKYRELKSAIRVKAAHENWMVRYNAIKGLGLTKDPEDIQLLEKLASDAHDKLMKKTALEAVQAIREGNVRIHPD